MQITPDVSLRAEKKWHRPRIAPLNGVNPAARFVRMHDRYQLGEHLGGEL
jgi:hypothetical protein